MARLSAILFWPSLVLVTLVWAYRLLYLAGPWGFEIGQQGLSVQVHWLFVILGAVMPYLLLFGAVLALIFLLFRSWRWFLFISLLMGLEIGQTVLRSQNAFGSPGEGKGDFAVAAFNMQANQGALKMFAALSQDADVIHLSEVPQAFEDIDFGGLFPNHEWHQVFYYPGYRGSMIVLVRGKSQVEVSVGANGNLRPIFDIRLYRNNQEVRVLASHPLAPFSPRMMAERNHTLNRFHALVQDGPDVPTILMGDMNTTPFEVDGWRLPGRLIGNPFQFSWSGLSHRTKGQEVARLRIDHIRLIQKGAGRLRPLTQNVGPDLGADHLPLFAAFQLDTP